MVNNIIEKEVIWNGEKFKEYINKSCKPTLKKSNFKSWFSYIRQIKNLKVPKHLILQQDLESNQYDKGTRLWICVDKKHHDEMKNILQIIREDFYQGYFDKIEQDNYVYFMYDAN